jgi:hypothetical protein
MLKKCIVAQQERKTMFIILYFYPSEQGKFSVL